MLALSDGSCPICRLPLPVVMLMTIKTTFLLCGNIKHDSVSWCNVQWLRSSQWLHPGAPASRCDCIQVRQHSGAPASRCTCIQVWLHPGVPASRCVNHKQDTSTADSRRSSKVGAANSCVQVSVQAARLHQLDEPAQSGQHLQSVLLPHQPSHLHQRPPADRNWSQVPDINSFITYQELTSQAICKNIPQVSWTAEWTGRTQKYPSKIQNVTLPTSKQSSQRDVFTNWLHKGQSHQVQLTRT